MNVSVRENEVCFFRYRNRLLAGVCLSVERGKARFVTSARDTVNVPVENVLLATGEMGQGGGAAAEWWARAEAQSAEMDLAEVWELVRDEGEVWLARDLADLYFGDAVPPDRLAALIVCLEQGRFFKADEAGYRPLAEAEVAERQEAEAREQAREAERALFQQWFLSGEEADVAPETLEDWVGRLKDYVLNGEQSAHVRWVERMSAGQANPRRAFTRLVAHGVWTVDENLDLIRNEAPIAFPEVVIRAADALSLDAHLEDGRRQDLTGVQVFTIDDETTTDMDDAVSVTAQEDGTYRVGVHITDVASLIPAGCELDREAVARGSSLYLPEQKIPMLPPQVSEGLGSLRPGEARLALSVLFDVAADGSVRHEDVAPSVVRCSEKLTYEQVDAILDTPSQALCGTMTALHRVAEVAWTERLQAGAISVDHPERKIRVTAEGQVEVTMRPRDSQSNMLVSELMVMANQAVARFCLAGDIPIVYRTQKAPDLSDVAETENEVLHRYRTLRQMRPAEMSMDPGPHGGLGLAVYCQASSPLRRFSDLAVQRQVVAALLGAPLPYTTEGIREVAFLAEERMREIVRMERRRERYWLLKYLSGFVGEEFEAMVLEAREREMRAEVLAYAFQTNARPSRPVTPGETIRLRLGRCDPWEDAISFTQVG